MKDTRNQRPSTVIHANFDKSSMKRGIVISPPVTIEGKKFRSLSGNLDPQELRFSLLFWDELVWPQNNIVQLSSRNNPDVDFLERCRVLTRPIQFYQGGDVATIMAHTMLSKFEELETREPGKWSLAQGERAFNLLHPSTAPGAMIELLRAIPIPKNDVPLNEILEFKQRRRDELLDFRNHLESLSLQIAQSESPDILLSTKLVEIDSACSNLLAVGREWQFPMQLSSIKASLNIEPTKVAMYTGSAYLGATHFGLPLAAAAAGVAAAGSIINIKGDIGFRSIKRARSPYRYAYEIDRELT